MTEGDAALAQIVGRQFDCYPVADQHPDGISAHPAAEMGRDLVAAPGNVDAHDETGVGQLLDDSAFHLDHFFLHSGLLLDCFGLAAADFQGPPPQMVPSVTTVSGASVLVLPNPGQFGLELLLFARLEIKGALPRFLQDAFPQHLPFEAAQGLLQFLARK